MAPLGFLLSKPHGAGKRTTKRLKLYLRCLTRVPSSSRVYFVVCTLVLVHSFASMFAKLSSVKRLRESSGEYRVAGMQNVFVDVRVISLQMLATIQTVSIIFRFLNFKNSVYINE